jgi:hypothetical protein
MSLINWQIRCKKWKAESEFNKVTQHKDDRTLEGASAVSIKLVSLFLFVLLGLILYFESKTAIIGFAGIAKSESYFLETALAYSKVSVI